MRKVIFWAHLCVGVAVGLVVLCMSATGVILTYERQILRSIDDGTATSGSPVLPAEQLLEVTLRTAQAAPERVATLRFSSTPSAPVLAKVGRNQQFLLDPGTGQVLRRGPSDTARFFSLVTRIHRWFALEGDARDVGRAITGYANLGFLFLLLSGIYLWLPKLWSGPLLQSRMLLKRGYASGKARDWSWHHVFSFWAAIPFLLIITTATVFYFSWSNALVYGFFGESVPSRQSSASNTAKDSPITAKPSVDANAIQNKIDTGMELADSRELQWRTLTVESALTDNTTVTMRFDKTIGGAPQALTTLTFKPDQPPVWETLADRTAGRQARSIIRFLHTGEVLGSPGQTIAGLASFAACLLVWSGLALAWRRLIRPILVRRTTSQNSQA